MVPHNSSSKNRKVVLLLEDGIFSIGYRFGAPLEVSSEATFSASMVSYAEAQADPAYINRILTLTCPFVDDNCVPGHYAKFNSEILFYFECDHIQVTVLTTNGVGIKPCCEASEITVRKWSTNGATENERR